jgi:hypothetical protein
MATSELMPFELAIRVAGTVAEAAGDQATDEAWDVTWTTPGKTRDERWAAEQAIFGEIEAWEKSLQADLLREIIGNPFRPVTIDPAWLTPNVIELAKRIYDERSFDQMPLLGDALEATGCDDPEIVNHCRGSGTHVRGCWVVDLILGKS